MDKPRLLVIDDEPALGGFVASVAKSCDYDVVVTQAAPAFREAYAGATPDLLSIDLGIPGGDGVEILRFLAQQNCTAPILIISGFDRRVLESAFSLGEALGLEMVGPFTKPVRLKELKEVFCGPIRSRIAARR